MSAGSKAANDRRAGQPIVVLMVLLGLWAGGRSVLWESPFPIAVPTLNLPAVFAEADVMEVVVDSPVTSILSSGVRPFESRQPAPAATVFSRTPPWRVSKNVLKEQLAKPPVTLASPQLTWMSAMSSVPVQSEITEFLSATIASKNAAPGLTIELPQIAASKTNRWSFDSWLFLRPNSIDSSGVGPTPATYGASQAGAVLRFNLAPSSDRRPAVYSRITTALVGSRESTVAAGISARPIARLPVSAHAEVRATRVGGVTEIRPAVFAVTEFAQKKLPLGLQLSTYGQAGYVGGNFATAFADGQAKVDRKVAGFNLATLRAGAGVWGGVQDDAGRLDIGPTASVDIKVGATPARVSMDYRHRIVGDAEPQSGVAITLSTGF